MRCDLEQRLVLDDAVARQVARLRFLFAPLRHCGEQGEEALVGGARLQALPRHRRIGSVQRRLLQGGDFLFHPRRAVCAFELLCEGFVHDAQMRHVGQRIFELAFGERPSAPVREARRLVDLGVREAARQGLVGSGFAEAAHHRSDLRVEHRIRNDVPLRVENLDVLP